MDSYTHPFLPNTIKIFVHGCMCTHMHIQACTVLQLPNKILFTPTNGFKKGLFGWFAVDNDQSDDKLLLQ